MNFNTSCSTIVPVWASTGKDVDFVTAIWHCAGAEGDPQKEALDLLLTYDETTGHLNWRRRPLCCFANYRSQCYWNSVYTNRPAGAENWSAPKSKPEERRKVCILLTFTKTLNGDEFIKRKLAHRIIWTMKRGRIPDGLIIDHENRNPFDNRLKNLRLCTNIENGRNKSELPQKSSKYHGVSLHSASGKSIRWSATLHGKYIGIFETESEAAHARELLIPHGDNFTRRNFT